MRRFFPHLAIVLWVFAWHGRALTGYFYGDDWFQIIPRSASMIAKTFAGDWGMGDQHSGGFYRPLVRVSFALDRIAWGNRPGGYHLTGLLLLAANALLLRALARRVLGFGGLATATALAFVLLPTQAETAWWVSARADLLACLGLLAGLVLWLPPLVEGSGGDDGRPAVRHPVAVQTLAAWGCVILGLLAKETAIAGVVLIPLLDALVIQPRTRNGNGPEEDAPTASDTDRAPTLLRIDRGRASPWVSWALRAVSPALIIAAAYLYWRTHVLGGIGGYLAGSTEPMTVDRVGDTFRQFLSGLAWPPGSDGAWGASWKLWVIVFGAGLVLSRFRRDLAFAVAGVLLTIAPMAGLGLSPLAGGRYMAIPGAFGVLAWAALVSPRWREGFRAIRWIPPAALVGFALLWTPVLLRASNLWAAASGPNRRAVEETWDIVRTLPEAAPGQVGIIPAPVPHGYHVWAPGISMPVTLNVLALTAGWSADWVDRDKPYPCPLEMRRPDGKVIRGWLNVPPDLSPGARVLRIASDGAVAQFAVTDVSRLWWDAEELAKWTAEGPGRIEGIADARSAGRSGASIGEGPGAQTAASDSATSRALHLVVEAAGFWLVPPKGSGRSNHGTASGESSVERRWITAGLSGRWNRAGTALLTAVETGAKPDASRQSAEGGRPTITIPVPPPFGYLEGYAQAEEQPWPPRWRLCPIDRPARVALDGLELIGYRLERVP